jgi:thiamine transport system ATP-binding protein
MLELDALAYAHPNYPPYSFTLRAEPGEITAVSGPSGSGKSTLLDLIAGFLKPTGGKLTFDGKDLLPLPPEQRPISILFQSETLFDHLTATKNVALGLPPNTPGARLRKAVTDALAEVNLPDIGRQRASTLSGGQKQRVALARTLLRNRPILLLDEPFSALDDTARTETRTLVRTLTEKHKWTTILVSHHADDIAALAAKRYRIERGTLLGS